jgi:hypothetical protein
MALELVRHGTADLGNWTTEEVAGYPPIPDVLPVLRRRVMGKTYRESEPTIFWPQDISWSAVLDLHKVGRHDDATALARVLLWCDQHSARHSAWEIREASADTLTPPDAEGQAAEELLRDVDTRGTELPDGSIRVAYGDTAKAAGWQAGPITEEPSTARPRSCPTCHDIMTNSTCRDPWHWSGPRAAPNA